jgi:biotin synthase-like enzyme
LRVTDTGDALRVIRAFRLPLPRNGAGGREVTLGDPGTRQVTRRSINAVIVGNFLTTRGAPPPAVVAVHSLITGRKHLGHAPRWRRP